MKFTLMTSENEGFKISTQADNEKELEVVKELTTLLIGKIEKIVVRIGDSDYERGNSTVL